MKRTCLALFFMLSLVICAFGLAEEIQLQQPKATETDLQIIEETSPESSITQNEVTEEKTEAVTEAPSQEESSSFEVPEEIAPAKEIETNRTEFGSDEIVDNIITDTDSNEETTDASTETENPVEQDGVSVAPVWDGELILGKLEKVSFGKDTDSKVYYLKIRRTMDVVVEAEDELAVSLTITTIEGKVLHKVRSFLENGKWMPIETVINLKSGEYLVHIQKENAHEEGVCRLTISQKEEKPEEDNSPSEETTNEELSTENDDAEIEALEDKEGSTDSKESEDYKDNERLEEQKEAELEETNESEEIEETAKTEKTEEYGETEEDDETEEPEEIEDIAESEEVNESEETEETAKTEKAEEYEAIEKVDETEEPEEIDDIAESEEANESEGIDEPSGTDNVEEPKEEESGGIEEPEEITEPDDVEVLLSNTDCEDVADEIEEESATNKADEPGESIESVETVKPEDLEEDLLEPSDEEISVRVIAILGSDSSPTIGTEVTLIAEVTGCDPDSVIIEWQYSPDGGKTIITVEDAHELEYHYTINRENFSYIWRAVVKRNTENPLDN